MLVEPSAVICARTTGADRIRHQEPAPKELVNV
jgi:hypothetical protein